MNSDEDPACVFCDRPKRMCAGSRSCTPAILATAIANKGDWEEKERQRRLRAAYQPADVVNTKRPAAEDGTLL